EYHIPKYFSFKNLNNL
ncbi:unnamed protein product, partial [Rotaria sp. Silwood2]